MSNIMSSDGRSVVGGGGGGGAAAYHQHLLIPALALCLGLLSLPPLIKRRKNATSKIKVPTSISGLLCDIWTLFSSVIIIVAWANCQLTFDGADILLAGQQAQAAAAAAAASAECSDLDDDAYCDPSSAAHHGDNYGRQHQQYHSQYQNHQHYQYQQHQYYEHPTLDQVSDAISHHCNMASLILGTAMVLELLQVLAQRAVARRHLQEEKDSAEIDNKEKRAYANAAKKYEEQHRQENTVYTLFGWHDSECLLLVYALLFFTHLLMSNDRAGETFGLIFAEPIAAMAGHYRPISTIRYIEWSIASPLLMSLIGRSIPRRFTGDLSKEKAASVSDTLRPSLIVTIAYIFLAWTALTITNPLWRIALIFFSFMGYIFSVADQLTSWKVGADHTVASAQAADMLLLIQIGVYGMYGAVFLLPLFGFLDPIAEQAALTYADATIKLTCSASLAAMRHADSLAEAKRQRTKAEAVSSDLRQIIHDANAPIFVLDADGRISLWNEKLVKLTKATLPDILGKPLENYLSEECRGEFQEIFEARKAGKSGTDQYHCDMIIQKNEHRGGGDDNDSNSGTIDHSSHGGGLRLVSLLMTATARHDAEGRFIGIVGVGTDLTEVTRIKAIEEKKNQFMAVVSHELKSPLHGIIGLAESLAQSEKMEDRKNQLKMVKSCAFRLLDLVSNIMQMSRLTRDRKMDENSDDGGGGDDRSTSSSKQGSEGNGCGRQQVRQDPVDIPSIINEVCMLVTNATDKGNRPILNPLVSFENNVSHKKMLPIVKGDAYKITQVFYNIITNACKFCAHGQITIDAGVNMTKDRLEVSVTDTGVGINPESVKRIFEPFEQETNSSRRSFGGIGLGLAISKEVIELHGGNIFVVSTPGKGSKFVVSLPVTEEEVALAMVPSVDGMTASTPENNMIVTTTNKHSGRSTGSLARGMLRRDSDASKLTSSARNSDGERMVILSVDDDFVNQEVIKSALSDQYELHVAMNGFEALEFFSTRSKLPDLVLLDVMMPGMDGFEVLKEIREEKQIPPTSLPIIMLSAMEPIDKALIQSLNSGANDYVSKPFDPDILKARVSTAVEIKRLRQIENESFHHSKLLHDILPIHIVERLILGDRSISERHESVCILFADIVGWTPMSETVPTHQLIDMLNQLFSEFDALTEKYGVYKADTIGDAYIVAAGHEGNAGPSDASLRVAEFAIEMLEKAKTVRPPNGMQLQLRVGIHTGPAYSGVVGTKVPKYTFFGDTVNTAARMEQTGVPNCINMSAPTRQALSSEIATCRNGRSLEGWLSSLGSALIRRDSINVKGKGAMELFLLCPRGISSQFARRMSKMQCRQSFNSSAHNSAHNASMTSISSVEEQSDVQRLNDELTMLKKDLKRLDASKQEAWAEVEILRLNLAESASELPGDNSISRDMSLSRRKSPNPPTQLTQVDTTPNQIEELKLQLLVTTKSLMRARKAIQDKEGEIDDLELQLQRVKSRLQGRTSDGELTRSISASTSLRSSFMMRTQELLDSNSSSRRHRMPNPRRKHGSRSSTALSSLGISEQGDDLDNLDELDDSLHDELDDSLHDDYDDEGITRRRR